MSAEFNNYSGKGHFHLADKAVGQISMNTRRTNNFNFLYVLVLPSPYARILVLMSVLTCQMETTLKVAMSRYFMSFLCTKVLSN